MESTEKKICIQGGVFSTLAFAFVLALPASAGVKYWDNPDFKAFDVGDYVQDGLVLNYDGIRNAGPTAPHDPAATTWKNLGSGGATYDMTKNGSPASSYWTGSGFYFDNKTWFVTPNKFDHGSAYEIESLVDAQHASQPNIGYIFFTSTAYPRTNDDGWRYGSIGIRAKGTTYNQAIEGTTYNGTLNLNTDRSSIGAGTAKRPVLLDEPTRHAPAFSPASTSRPARLVAAVSRLAERRWKASRCISTSAGTTRTAAARHPPARGSRARSATSATTRHRFPASSAPGTAWSMKSAISIVAARFP